MIRRGVNRFNAKQFLHSDEEVRHELGLGLLKRTGQKRRTRTRTVRDGPLRPNHYTCYPRVRLYSGRVNDSTSIES